MQRLPHRSTAATAAGGFAAERRAGRRYRPTASAGAQQQRIYTTITNLAPKHMPIVANMPKVLETTIKFCQSGMSKMK